MLRDRDHTTINNPTGNDATIGTIRAIVDRQVSELRTLAGSPGERAWLAQIAGPLGTVLAELTILGDRPLPASGTLRAMTAADSYANQGDPES